LVRAEGIARQSGSSSELPVTMSTGKSTCPIQLNAPTASRLVAVSMIVSSIGCAFPPLRSVSPRSAGAVRADMLQIAA
jgi:hypothetical protein